MITPAPGPDARREHPGGHLDGERDGGAVEGEEEEANRLAASWLLPAQEVRAWLAQIGERVTSARLTSFAEAHHVHPAIVVGRLQHMKAIPFTHHRGVLVKVREQLEPWAS